ncbi:hypothetical protein B23_3627 [Geobacillus thermoleovorans B23]|nr:hypothetical protein B23_3627 [Geobacillus thermoleovorans B23]
MIDATTHQSEWHMTLNVDWGKEREPLFQQKIAQRFG